MNGNQHLMIKRNPVVALVDAGTWGRKRPQVLDAARELFLREGFVSTTMDSIAAKAGVSKATLYAYYPGKSDVFVAIVLNEVELLSRALADIVRKSDLLLRDRLIEIGRRMLVTQLRPENVNLFRMVISSAQRFPDLGKAMSSQCRIPVRTVMTQLMEAADREGALRCPFPEHAASVFLTLMRSDLLLNALIDPHADLISEEALRVHIFEQVDVFLAAFSPPGA
jgi:TetR/AcrR family transcriptional repressor of mexJK operon